MSAIPTVDDTRTDIAQTPREPVAIVGIGCRLPGGARSAEGFWSNLIGGVNGIVEVPPDRWSLEGFYDPERGKPGRSVTKWGGFIDQIDQFDAGFFGISPREAAEMDPQQRLMLQVAWEALEDAGIAADQLKGSPTGVFVGVSINDYAMLQKFGPVGDSVHAGTGTALSIVANRISHRLDLQGPSFAVDTACSSSIVAVDQACRNLRDGACDIALAGGVNALLEPTGFLAFSAAGMMSTDGKIHAFDAGGTGYVRGEGAGMLVLKKLSAAQAAGDRIYAVIRSTSVNQDGTTTTLTAPRQEAQMAMMRKTCGLAGITPDQVGYVEAHGTGTPVGDPIEAGAIGSVFGQAAGRDGKLPIGSVKTQIGHLESAAGIAGLIKAALALHHRTLPASLNFEVPNPNIPFDELNIEVVAAARPVDAARPIVMVNSFGFGGTNAGALLEAAPPAVQPATAASPQPHPALLAVSAASAAALKTRVADIAGLLRDPDRDTPTLADLAGTLALRRAHLNHRVAIVARTIDEARDRLAAFAEDRPMPGVEEGAPPVAVTGRRDEPAPVAFVFAGQGGQSWRMARELLTTDPIFRATVDEFDGHFSALAGWSVIDALMADEASSRINSTDVTQPAIFAVQIGLVARWRAFGIEPDMVLGHSFGEVAAGYTAGAISLEDAAQIIYHRGRLQDATQGTGGMAAIAMSADEVRARLRELGEERVEIAADNGPQMVTVAGDKVALEAFVEGLLAADPDLFCRVLKIDYAAHSQQMESIKDVFVGSLAGLQPKPTTLTMISTVSGKALAPGSVLDADYWWQNVRKPVLFQDALGSALAAGAGTFVEIGPHATLSGIVAGGLLERGAKGVAVPSLHAKHGDYDQLLASLAELYVRGYPVRFAALVDPDHRRVRLPAYPWENQHFWAESEELREALFKPKLHPLLGRRSRGPAAIWRNEISLRSHAFIAEHRVDGAVVFPGAGYVEMMLAAAAEALGELPLELEQVVFHEALFIQDEQLVQFETHFEPERRQLRVFSRLRDAAPEWTLRAAARVRHGAARVVPFGPLEATSEPVAAAAFYDLATRHGHQYGPLFQGVTEIRTAPDISLGQVSVPDGLADGLDGYLVHPAILDACLQVGIGLHLLAPGRQQAAINLPTGIGQLRVFKRPTSPLDVAMRMAREDDRGASCDIVVRDQDGDLVMTLGGFRTRKLPARSARAGKSVSLMPYQEFWQEEALDLPPEGGLGGTWLIFADAGGTGATLAGTLAARGAVPVLVAAGTAFEALADGGFRIRPGDAADMERLVETVAEGAAELTGIVHLWSLEDPAAEPVDGAALMAAQEATTLAALHLVQALARREALAPRLYLATRGANLLPVEQEAGVSALRLARAPLVGFVRTAANEQPQLRLTLVDLDPASPHNGEGAAADLMAEILADSPELEVALRGEHRYVNRVDAVPAESLPKRLVSAAALGASRDYRLTMPAPGVFDNLFVTETDRVEPAAGQAVVAVKAVGLNFRDVLAAADLLPEGAEDVEGWQTLGIEYAGVVRAVGPDVTTVAPGDRVMGSAKACLGSAIAVPAASLQPIPDSLDFTAAATLPAAFMTAHLALNELGRMAKGDKVLIHVATGGVGLAAIQLARLKGCEIFATAGTDEKRAHLRSLGIEHVMNSRTLDFADEIMAATQGTGVDLVLNSLPGPFIDKGLGVLAPYGRFLEIGKRDLFADKPVGLASLKNSNAFITINLEAMGRERPAEVRRVFTDVATMLAEGRITPLPTTTFPLSSAAEAFRFMSQAKHIGKVVIEIDEAGLEVALDPERPLSLDADGAYLVTGGLAGFGLEVARTLGRAKAGQLVLMSRSGAASDEAKATVAELEAAGTVVTVVAGDVTRPADVDRAVAAAGADGRRLKGVVHAAMVLDDGFITQLDRDRFATALAPKMVGGWNLHRATLGQELDFFVLFSSVAALLGSTGQANYVAGNAFLDKLAVFRRAAGLPGLSLAWGALGGKGFVARNAAIQSYLESQGIVPLEIDEALATFDRAVRLDPGAVAQAKVDWGKLGKAQTVVSGSPRVAHLLAQGEDGKAAGGRARAAILAAPAARRPVLLAKFLKEQVGRVLRVEPAEIDADRPLSELGLDSLTSFELKNRIETELGVSLPAGKFLQKPTISGLTQAISENLGETVAENAAETADAVDDNSLPLTAWQDWVMRIEDEAPRAQAARGMNHLAAAMSVSPPVEADRLAKAVEAAIARHPGLRLTFVDGPSGHEARVVEQPGWGLAVSDHRSLDDEAFAALLAAKRDEPYDLARGPMIRIELIHRADDTDVILLCAHHAILDGWSLMLLFNEMFVDYVGLELDDDGGKRFDAVDFARWQRRFMASDEGRQQLDYWLERLRDLGPPLPLPYDRQPGAGGKLDLRQGDFVRMELPRRLADRVAQLAQDGGTSRYVVLLAAFKAFLARLTERTDLLVTASVAGRTRPELEQVIGAVRNYVAVRSTIDPRSSFADLVRETAGTVADALAHQDYPGFEVFDRVEPGYSAKRTIVDQVGFQMLRPTNLDDRGFGQLMLYEGGRKASFGSIEAETLSIEERGCYRELTFYEVEHEGNIYLMIHYETDLFSAVSAKRMLESYILTLERAIMQPAIRVRDLLSADSPAAALEAGER